MTSHMNPPVGVPTLALATVITATTQAMVATAGGVMDTFTEDITAPSAVTTLPTPTLVSIMEAKEAMEVMEATAADQILKKISAAMGRVKMKAQNIGQRNWTKILILMLKSKT